MSRIKVLIRLSVVLIVNTVALYGAAADGVPEVPPPKYWDTFKILLYQFNPADKALAESVNLHGLHLDGAGGINPAKNPLAVFARESKWPLYFDHAADKGYLHLYTPAEQAKYKPAKGEKNDDPIAHKKTVVSRPKSLVDPKIIEAMKSALKVSISAAQDTNVLAFAFDDEISTGEYMDPDETDGSPQSIAGYRKWLEKQYQNIGRLNAEWGTAFSGFADVQPESYEQVRGQLTTAGLNQINLSPWCDWRSYMDTQFADCLADLTRFANSLNNGVPAGFVGAQAPCAYGGYDYYKLSKAVQWIEPYDMGGAEELLRSFWGQQRPRMETYFSSGNAHKDAWFLWYNLCRGSRGVICWAKYKDHSIPKSKPVPWFENGQVLDFIKANAETYKELQGPVSQTIINGEFAHDPVAIYYSHPSIQLTWALDASVHGPSWPNRRSSTESALGSSSLSRVGWLKTLEDLGIQAAFVHQEDLLSGELRKRGFKVLLLNRTLCLSDAEAEAIKNFTHEGGTVVADHLCGICDEHGKIRPTGALDDLFAVKRDLSRGWLGGKLLTEVDGESDQKLSAKNWAIGATRYQQVAVVERGLTPASDKVKAENAEGAAVVVRNGNAVYLNLSPIGHLVGRANGTTRPWLETVARILKDAGVEPRVQLFVDGKPAQITEPVFWRNGERTTLCVVKNLSRDASIDDFGSTGGALGESHEKLKLQFAAPVKNLKNERTGKVFGDGAAFEDDFTPWEANVYTFSE